MANFIFEAVDKDGAVKKGELQSDSKLDVLDYLSKQNLTPISIREKTEAFKASIEIFSFERIKAVDRILLTKHLSAIIKAGISLTEAIDILIANTEKKIMKKILTDAKYNLERGQTLSSTFEHWSKYFSPVFTGIIKAGEISGNLEKSLEQLGDQLTRDNELVKKVRGAMIYPIILLTTSFLVVLLMITFVLPRLAKAFLESGLELPTITKILLWLSDVLSYSPILTFSIFIGILAGFSYLLRTVRGRRIMSAVAFRLPAFNKLLKRIALTRFSHTLSNLLSSGIPITEALDITAKAVVNSSYERAINDIKEEIKKGASITGLLKQREDLFPSLLTSMVLIGEKTGTLEKTLKTVANFYEEEVDRTLKNLVSLIEPVLLLIMGVVVAGIALSILIPIYSLVGSLK